MSPIKPFEDGMKSNKKSITSELLKKFSANGITIKPSLLKLYKQLSVFLSLFFISNVANAQAELGSFSANFNGRKAKLAWSTSWETNSNYFIVERSWNGKSFEPVGMVKAQGNPSAASNYSFIDKDYYDNVIYYRLKVADNAGQEKILGGIISIQLQEDVKQVSIYPIANVTTAVYMDVSKLSSDKIIVDAIDADGQKLISKQLNKLQSEVAIELKSQYLLQQGEYSLAAFFDNHVVKTKMSILDPSQNLSENTTGNKDQFFTLK